MPSSSDVFAPVREERPAAPAAATGASESEPAPLKPGEFDFEGEDRPDEKEEKPEAGESLSPEEMISGMGITPSEAKPGAPSLPAPPALAPTGFGPPSGFGPPPGAWGVRVLSTVAEAQPPRAILGFADGSETVVTPGSMLPGARVVVLAIGRDAVQVAEVTPEGDHARVTAQTLTALYPGR
jgi:hypothetical protein